MVSRGRYSVREYCIDHTVAGSKCAAANVCDGVRNRDLRQTFTMIKCPIFNCCDAVRDLDTSQTAAVGKCIAINQSYTIRDDNTCHAAAFLKRLNANARHGIFIQGRGNSNRSTLSVVFGNGTGNAVIVDLIGIWYDRQLRSMDRRIV